MYVSFCIWSMQSFFLSLQHINVECLLHVGCLYAHTHAPSIYTPVARLEQGLSEEDAHLMGMLEPENAQKELDELLGDGVADASSYAMSAEDRKPTI
jgi:hypothetical protein